MTYLNLQMKQTSVSATWGGSLSLTALGLDPNIKYSDQIEVERIFTLSDLIKNQISTYDLHHIFIVDPTKYTVDQGTATLTGFSLDGTSTYTCTQGNLSTTTITIPAVSTGDSVIVRRKTYSTNPYVSWAAGTRLTSQQLNKQVDQLLRLNQELMWKMETEYVRKVDLTGTVSTNTAVITDNLNMNNKFMYNLALPSSMAFGDGNGQVGINKAYLEANYVNMSQSQVQTITGAKTFSGAITASAGIYGSLLTAAQPNITSVGTLTSLGISGPVSIGTANTNYKLNVANTSAASVASFSSNSAYTDILIANNSSGSYLQAYGNSLKIFAGSGATAQYTFGNDSSLNIGSTRTAGWNAGQRLLLSNNDNEGLEFIVADSANSNVIQSYNRNTPAYNTIDLRASQFLFKVGNSTKVIIDSAGKVGIGKASANYMLDVGGAINSDAGVYTPNIKITGTASTDINVLDRYEEGSYNFVPADVGFSTTNGTYTLAASNVNYVGWTKIGNRIMFEGYVTITGITTAGTGQFRINTVNIPSVVDPCWFTCYYAGLPSSGIPIGVIGQWTGNAIYFYKQSINVSGSPVTSITGNSNMGVIAPSDITTTFQLRFSGCGKLN